MQVGSFHVVQTQGASQPVQHFHRDVGLAALLQAAVVVRAEAGQYGEFFLAQTRHSAGPGERGHPGLGRCDAVASGAEKGSQCRAFLCHHLTVRQPPPGYLVML